MLCAIGEYVAEDRLCPGLKLQVGQQTPGLDIDAVQRPS